MVIAELGVLVALILVAVGCLVYWGAVAYHVVRTMRTIPTARAGLSLPVAGPDGAAPAVCVIVPAHNEAACIGEVAATLARQDYAPLSCVFALDRCTDDTRAVLEAAWAGAAAEAAKEGRAGPAAPEVIEISQCPEGWTGKTHALHVAATASGAARDAALLLFVDADTSLDPGLVRAAVALMRERGLGMLSLLSTLSSDRWFERVVQPAATMELLRQYPIVRANARERRRAFANGQFILIERGAYDRIGGHVELRHAVLEDVELARRCEWHDVAAGLFLADGLLRCRMYDSYAAFVRGWKRIYTESANRKGRRLRRTARRVRLIGTALPLGAVAAVAVGVWRLDGPHHDAAVLAVVLGGLGAAVHFGIVAVSHVLGRTPVWAAAAFPVGSWMVGGIIREAADDLETGRPTEWAGMAYQRAAR